MHFTVSRLVLVLCTAEEHRSQASRWTDPAGHLADVIHTHKGNMTMISAVAMQADSASSPPPSHSLIQDQQYILSISFVLQSLCVFATF